VLFGRWDKEVVENLSKCPKKDLDVREKMLEDFQEKDKFRKFLTILDVSHRSLYVV
jgi:hypothetical protein